MKLAIFDIDGTLSNTSSVDNECFVKAFIESGIEGINTNWDQYAHTCDSGITLQVFQERFGRGPDETELRKLKSCFVDLLHQRYQLSSSEFAEIAGASIALQRLKQEPGWAIAIATGCWRDSALLKLKAANIQVDKITAAYAEDGISREQILQAAVSKALSQERQDSFEEVVSLGDGVWDVRAAARLGFAFLGVGNGKSAVKLRQAGAGHVVKDFADYVELIRLLNEAVIPSQSF